MKICDFMKELYSFTENTQERYVKTCDTLKAGDPEQEITGIASAMFAAPAVIRAAGEQGANLLIVHEPAFYDHWDDLTDLENFPEPKKSIIQAKLDLAKRYGITIFRYHDHPHYRDPDYISIGEVSYWGLKGTWKRGEYCAVNEFELDEPMSVMDLTRTIEKNLNIQRIRIFGSTKTVCKKIGLCFGTPGHLGEELLKNDVLVTGEICEWGDGEMVRDYCELLGKDKSILVMGHIGSERDGMRLLADVIREKYPQFKVQYIECGESFTFTH